MLRISKLYIVNVVFVLALCSLGFSGCGKENRDSTENTEKGYNVKDEISENAPGSEVVSNGNDNIDIGTEEYNFINKSGKTIKDRINTPKDFKRVKYGIKSFGYFLENYPLYKDGKKVVLYDGTKKMNQSDHIAVFRMKLADGDLQQCADSVMRLYAEYLYSIEEYDKISFHLVNGFACDYSKWRQGMRVAVSGDDTSWVKSEAASNSKKILEGYLRFVFAYASTLSMEKESKRINKKDIEAGDIFIYGGSPGHVVMVLDVCESKDGEKAFLLGQGYMPAQQFHVLKNPLHEDDPWYYVKEILYPFQTPEYTFDKGSLKRPEYLG